MTTLTAFSTADGLTGQNGTSASAVQAGTASASGVNTGSITVAWEKSGTSYFCYQGFVTFDATSLSGATVTSAVLRMVASASSNSGDHTVAARVYNYDYGTTLDQSDYRTQAQLAALTNRSDGQSLGGLSSGSVWQTQLSSPATAVSTSAPTRLIITDDKFAGGAYTPTSTADVSLYASAATGTTNDPQLAVEYVPASGGATVIFYPSVDGYINSNNASYATAVAGTGTVTALSAQQTYQLGQSHRTVAPAWIVFEAFIAFDTSALPDTCTISSAALNLTRTSGSTTGGTPTLKVFPYDFGTSVDTADWRTPTQLSALTASGTLTSPATATSPVSIALTTSDISKTGSSKFVLATSDLVASDSSEAAGNSTEIDFANNNNTTFASRPTLTVVYVTNADYAVASGLTGTGVSTGAVTADHAVSSGLTGVGALGAAINGDTAAAADLAGTGVVTATVSRDQAVSCDVASTGVVTNTGYNYAVASGVTTTGVLGASRPVRQITLTATALGYLQSSGTTDATALSGSSLFVGSTGLANIGQQTASTTKYAYQGFARFDTSSLSGVSIGAIKLTLRGILSNNNTTTAANVHVLGGYARGASLATTDWRTPTQLSALTDLGNVDFVSGEALGTIHDITLSQTSGAWLHTSGNTDFVLATTQEIANDTSWEPAGNYYDYAQVLGSGNPGYEPVLTITTSDDHAVAAGVSATGAVTAAASRDDTHAASSLAGSGVIAGRLTYDVASAVAGTARVQTITLAEDWSLHTTSNLLGSAAMGWNSTTSGGSYSGNILTTTRAVFGEASATHSASITSPALCTGWRGLAVTTSLGSSRYTYTKNGVSQGTFDPTLDYHDLDPAVYVLSVDFSTADGYVDGLYWERNPVVSLQAATAGDLTGVGVVTGRLTWFVAGDLAGAGVTDDTAIHRGQPVASPLAGAGLVDDTTQPLLGHLVVAALAAFGVADAAALGRGLNASAALSGLGIVGARLTSPGDIKVIAALKGVGVATSNHVLSRGQHTTLNAALRGNGLVRVIGAVTDTAMQRAGMKSYGWAMEDGQTWLARWMQQRGLS